MKKKILFYGTRTPVLSLIITVFFIIIFLYASQNYYVDKFITLEAKVQYRSTDTIDFQYDNNALKNLKTGSSVYLSSSPQSPLIKGNIVSVNNNNYTVKLNRSVASYKDSVIKVVCGREPIIRRLF